MIPRERRIACVADALNLLYIDGLYKGFRRVRGPAATQASAGVRIEQQGENKFSSY